jgi:DNA repair protein RadC
MARSSKNNYVGTLRQVNTFAVGGAVYPDLSMQKPQVVNDSIQLAEFELKQAKELTTINNIKNQKILSSDDAVDIFRQIWEKDTISAYEQAYVLFVNTNNKPIGFYHHSSGGIDGTIMDIQMISGMAVKSLSKGVIIAHNHPSGNIQPSEADKKITEQMKEALQLFNIKLLDSLILTENNYLSFANMGIL